jgi:hypothetical protein
MHAPKVGAQVERCPIVTRADEHEMLNGNPAMSQLSTMRTGVAYRPFCIEQRLPLVPNGSSG